MLESSLGNLCDLDRVSRCTLADEVLGTSQAGDYNEKQLLDYIDRRATAIRDVAFSNGLSEEETARVASAIAKKNLFLSEVDFDNKSARNNVEILNSAIKNPRFFESIDMANYKNLEQNSKLLEKNNIFRIKSNIEEKLNEKRVKVRVISSREEIPTLNPNEHVIHLAFRPSNEDIFLLTETCPKITTIVIRPPKLDRDQVSRSSVEMFLGMQGIQLIKGDIWEHRNDIIKYYTIPSSVFEMSRNIDSKDTPVDILKHRFQKIE